MLFSLLGTRSAGATPAPPVDAAAADLQQQALRLGLADDPMWHKLLHYRRHPLTRRLRSLADDPGFFTAPNGRSDPQAELLTTLAAFLDPRADGPLGQPAACRFPARHAWLRERLGADAQRLPSPPCPRLQQWLDGLDAQRISLVYPGAFLNSPGSMYGHTFLRLDGGGVVGEQALLAHAISYAAHGSEADGVMFALRGLFGGYDGVLSTAPYYLRIRDYTHLENRDIWEYELALTPAQIDRLLRHAWELSFTRFDYFFFDENCSYHLLTLLDVARDDLFLADRFTFWAIPVDTVRAVTDTPGLVRRQHHRPSNGTELRWRARQLPTEALQGVDALAHGRLDPAALGAQTGTDDAGLPRQAEVLELAERQVSYLASVGDLDAEQAQRTRVALLSARAQLPVTPQDLPPQPQIAPQQGHRTPRVDLRLGRRDGRMLWQAAWRSSYHDLMDPEPGFSRGAQIEIGRFEWAQQAGERPRLEQARLIDIVSLAPREPLVQGWSWKLRLGWQRSASASPSPWALDLNGGPGLAVELDRRQSALAYALMDNQIWRDPALGSRRWAFGTGLQIGLLWDATPRWRWHLQAYRRVFAGAAPAEQGASWQQRLGLDTDTNLAFSCELRRREAGATPAQRQQTCTLGVQRYW